MKHIRDFFERGNILPGSLIATAIIAFFAILGAELIIPTPPDAVADMYIVPSAAALTRGETLTIQIMVDSTKPVNVFAGELRFDPQVLTVAGIDYNTSIADLWAELPWYNNGDGTLNFGGGTTQKGGFIGSGALITVTFRSVGTGTGSLTIHDPRILLHNGLGTDAPLERSIDAIITIDDVTRTEVVALGGGIKEIPLTVTEKAPSTDLNSDGKQSIADVSIFMLYATKSDLRGDLDRDGKVNTKDLNIILSAK